MADSDLSPSKWRQLLTFAKTASRHPLQTFSLINATRVKNLYITLFRQNEDTRAAIFHFYQDLYREEATVEAEALQPASISVPDGIFVFPTASSSPLVTIIVPVFNQYETTLRCLASVLKHTSDIDYELILADDASTDRTRNIQRRVHNIRVTRMTDNSGFVDNCNQAAQIARGELIVFLNNDTEVLANWLVPLVGSMKRYQDIGLTGPKFLFPNGKVQEAGGIVWRDGGGWNYGRGMDPTRPEFNYIKDVDYISGACLCIRRTLWEDIGGFDPRYRPAYYEDTDLAFAVRERGYRVVYQPGAEVIHDEGTSHGVDTASGIKRFQEENRIKFEEKWRDRLHRDHFPDERHLFRARDRSVRAPIMLMVDHHVPFYDRDAGSKSTFQYIRWFAASGLRVKFIGDNFYQHEPYTRALEEIGVEVLYGPQYQSGWRDWMKRHGAEIDYVYLHRPHIAIKYIREVRQLTQAKVIYFGHDLHWLRLERQYAIDGAPTTLAQSKQEKRREFDLFRQSDVIYYPSAVEADQVKRDFPDKTVRAIPLYVMDRVEPEPDDFEQRGDLLFVGGFAHPPNLDAITWFLRAVFPFLCMTLPDCRLTIVGSNPPDRLRRLARERVVLREDLSEEELTEQYTRTRIAVVPLRFGAGIKGKILEAMRMQVPVVTTSIGAEGLPEAQPPYLAIADSAADFLQVSYNLYTNSPLWQEQREQGRKVFNQHFTPSSARAVLGMDIAFPEPEHHHSDTARIAERLDSGVTARSA